MGRNVGFTAWELEAARRREVLARAIDTQERSGEKRSRERERGGFRVPSWLVALGRGDAQPAPTHDPECQPRLHAARPGS